MTTILHSQLLRFFVILERLLLFVENYHRLCKVEVYTLSDDFVLTFDRDSSFKPQK